MTAEELNIRLRTLGAPSLLGGDGEPLHAVLSQPKRFALLAYLAVARPHGIHQRDTLLAVLWPELDRERGRAALRKAVHWLRRALGPDVILSRGQDGLELNAARVHVDVCEFEHCLAAGRNQDAVALYVGDLLPGFFVSDAPEFERWLDQRREQIRRSAVDAALAAARDAEPVDAARSLALANRAVVMAAEDEVVLREVLELYERVGDAAGALHLFAEHTRRLTAELDMAPSPRTQALADAIRNRCPATTCGPAHADDAPSEPASADQHGPAATVQPAASTPVDNTPHPNGSLRLPRRTRKKRALKTVAAMLVAVVMLLGAWGVRSSSDESSIVAVGVIRDYTSETGAADLSAAVVDLLAGTLSRAGHPVVSSPRLFELLAKSDADPAAPREVAAAARRAGATELLEGAVHPLDDGRLRLDLRRVALDDGAIRASYSVSGHTAVELVERAMVAMHGGSEPTATPSTQSMLALAMYQQGLRSYYEGRRSAAAEFFHAALAEDSTFAMAAYYLARAHENAYQPYQQYLELAMRLAGNASELERLQIRAAWATLFDDPAILAIADTLSRKYPTEPDGHYHLGNAMLWHGRFLEALPHLKRAAEVDSFALRTGGARCLACDALGAVSTAYMFADSFAAAERFTRGVMQRTSPGDPGHRTAKDVLAGVYAHEGRYNEAMRLRGELGQTGEVAFALYPATLAIHAGDFRAADEVLRQRVHDHNPDVRTEALWQLAISLRSQGRYREALGVARDLAAMETGDAAIAPRAGGELMRSVILFEMGRADEAARIHRERGRSVQSRSDAAPSWVARHATWSAVHEATAHAAVGDTVALRALADSMQQMGRRSNYGRDHRLHHHVRGLIHRIAGNHEDAATEFQAAIFSYTAGYTRSNYELGRTLLELDSADEAVAVLEPALRGSIESSNMYVTRTELRELLGRAYEAAGRMDAAREQYRLVVDAWQHADPEVHVRRNYIMTRYRMLGRYPLIED